MMKDWSKKIWFILINDKEEGPYSATDLRSHPHVTPDTLARKSEKARWRPIREIDELKELFDDSEEGISFPSPSSSEEPPSDELTIPLQEAPPPLRLWLLIIIAVLFYVILTLLWH